MSKIGIGVIGLGRMGSVYGYYAARQIENAELIAIADPREEITTDFADKVGGVETYSDYHELLADPTIEGVIIATPTSTHRDIVIEAAKAKKAIFCEKPTALTLSATDDMIAAVEKAGVMFQVGFMRRFDRGYGAAAQQIADGVIGDPVVIRSIGRDPYRTTLEYADPKVSGGLLLDMAIHDFDIIRWFMNDDIERVYTEVSSLVYPELQEVGDVDNAMVNLRFRKGGLGNVEVSRTAIYGYDIQCDIIGTRGGLKVGYLQETPVITLTQDGARHDIVPYFQERFGLAYTRQIEHFVECLAEDKAPIITPADARAALQAAIAATVSQHEARVVNVAEVQ